MKRARSRLGLSLVLGMLAVLLPVGALPVASAGPGDVVINELDSDTASTDVLEFVELFDGGSGSTALDGLVVVFYNGSSDLVYDAFDLDGFSTDAGGYFTLGNAGVVPTPSIVFASNGLQNGADAVALYVGDATDFPDNTALTTANLVDAIVYDTNDGDDAELLALLNAGQPQVNEGGAGDKDFHSSQRCPNGAGGALNTDTYSQFAPTPGAANNCPPPSTPDVVINELDSDTASTDVLEFVELFDGGSGSTALDGLVVVFYNGSSDLVYDAFDLDGFSTDAGGYFTLGNAGVVPTPSIVFASNGLQNGADAVALYVGDATDFPDNTALTTANLVDAIVYDTNDGDDAELLALLNAGQPQVNEGGAGDKDFHSSQRCPNGAGGALNTDTYSQFAPTPGAANNCPPPSTPDVVINELDSDTASTDVLEFVELFDGGSGSTALDGLVVVFYNGSSDLVYDAFDLDGFSTDAGGYFTLGNAGVVPTPSIVFASNGLQNGADAVALYVGDATDFPDNTALTTANLVDAIVYDTNDGDDAELLALLNAGQPQVNEGGAGDKDFHSSQRCPNGAGGALNTDTYSQFAPTPGSENTCEPPVVFGACGDPAVAVHDVQGPGSASPLLGTSVVLEAVVVGDFQEYTGEPNDEPLDGFMIQEEDADADADPATSEGIFIYDPGGTNVAAGDLVRVKGTVSEFFDLTELGSVTDLAICSNGNPAPTPATPNLPTNLGDPTVDWEAIEGMSVSFAQPLYVTGSYSLGSFGELQLSAIGAQNHPNQVAAQGSSDAADIRQLNFESRVILDDGEDENESYPNSSWNPSTTPYLVQPEGTLRSGDVVNTLTGVVHYSFGEYEVQPVNVAEPTYPAGAVDFVRLDARPDVPDVRGTLKVGSFNVLNYFTTLGDRGAYNQFEFDRQATKIVDAIIKLDADILGLMEIENNGTAVNDLVSKLNGDPGATRVYDYVNTGVVGTDAIAVAFIYDRNTVNTVGDFALLDSSVSPAFLDTKNRPAIAQTFEDAATGEMITLAVNHLKSKGSSCATTSNPGDASYGVAPYSADPELADFAGNCNLTRTAAAKVLGQWLAADPTATGAEYAIVLGDLNSYANEDPITTLEALGYADLNEVYSLGNAWADGGHTYVFDGELGSLDYAMANTAVLKRVTGAAAWHINADEPSALDYNDYNPATNYDPDEWRASDHDPVIVGLDLAQPKVDKGVVLGELSALLPAGDMTTTKRIARAVADIEDSLNPEWWGVDDQTVTSKKVFDEERKAVATLELVVASGVPEAAAAQAAIDVLVNADRQLARIAIITATADGGNAVKLVEAEAAMADAADLVEAGLYNEAINAYKQAWDKATKA